MTPPIDPDDLRERIAFAVCRELVQQAQAAGEYQTRDSYRIADRVIAALSDGIHTNGTWAVIDLLIELAGPRCFAEGENRCDLRQGTEPLNPRYKMTEGTWINAPNFRP